MEAPQVAEIRRPNLTDRIEVLDLIHDEILAIDSEAEVL
jgi:hypothetical protein